MAVVRHCPDVFFPFRSFHLLTVTQFVCLPTKNQYCRSTSGCLSSTLVVPGCTSKSPKGELLIVIFNQYAGSLEKISPVFGTRTFPHLLGPKNDVSSPWCELVQLPSISAVLLTVGKRKVSRIPTDVGGATYRQAAWSRWFAKRDPHCSEILYIAEHRWQAAPPPILKPRTPRSWSWCRLVISFRGWGIQEAGFRGVLLNANPWK